MTVATLRHPVQTPWRSWLVVVFVWLALTFCTVMMPYAYAEATTEATTATTTETTTDTAADTALALGAAKIKALGSVRPLTAVPLPASTLPNAKSASSAASSEHAPAPTVDQGNGQILALPTLNAPVVDQAGALNAADLAALSSRVRSIHDAGRAQIGIILVKTTQGETIFDYAGRAFTTWKLGEKGRDDGLLIVVAVQDRKIQILTGYGLEGVIPDVIASRIIREQITPQFKAGNYAAGLNAGLDRIDDILKQDPETAKAAADQAKAAQQAHQQGQGGIPLSLVLMVIVLILIGEVARMMFGQMLSAVSLGAVGVGAGLLGGAGLAASMMMGGVVFIFLLVGIWPILNLMLSGGRGGGFGGDSGYRGGGGSFGGGGASGSW